MLLLLFYLLPKKSEESSHENIINLNNENISWFRIVLMYGLCGLGYIVVATYLPLISNKIDSIVVTKHLWSFVGIGIIPSCYFWILLGNKFGYILCLKITLFIQSFCILLITLSDNSYIIIACSIGFSATFMGIVALVMPIVNKIQSSKNFNLIGLATLSYGI